MKNNIIITLVVVGLGCIFLLILLQGKHLLSEEF